MANYNGNEYKPATLVQEGDQTLIGNIRPPSNLWIEGAVGGCPILYVHQGYYAAGATYEKWYSISQSGPPPSGHTLIGTSFVPVGLGPA